MEYAALPFNTLPPQRLSGYFGIFEQGQQASHSVQIQQDWMATLSCLHNQRGYLESLLSKTATTLNALRDRQSKNERALCLNPTPRSKKKKIQQNRWRTEKTIKTCENEEKVILDCLEVCNSNISTLESILKPSDGSSTAPDYTSSASYLETDSTETEFEWNGWAGMGDSSPFQRQCRKPSMVDDIPPEEAMSFEERSVGKRKPPPLPPRNPPLVPLSASPSHLPSAPPRMAHESNARHSILSPEAACFEPTARDEESSSEKCMDLDKLSISGLLASKRVQAMVQQKRRFSDSGNRAMFRPLLRSSRSGVVSRQQSCPPLGRKEQEAGPKRGGLRRMATS